MYFPAKELWLPDIVILNSDGSDGFIKITDFNMAVVCPYGNIYLLLKAESLQTRCKLNAMKFPYDRQTCRIEIASWANPMNLIRFSNESNIDVSDLISNPEWNMENISFYKSWSKDRMSYKRGIEEWGFSEQTKTFEELSIVFNVKRKPLNFMLNAILPNLILNVILLFCFFLKYSTAIGICKKN